MSSVDWYAKNPMTRAPLRASQPDSAFARSLDVRHCRPLIVCRGPIRKEAMDVFADLGITEYGILLSEKDSIVYQYALAPELRLMRDEHVHRVKDYSGVDKAERTERVAQIVSICKKHRYTHVFAGYGFMAEDEDFARTVQNAGIGFLGPSARVHAAAGRKDEAKRTALSERVSVTPGIDDVTARALLRKYPDVASLRRLVAERGLDVPAAALGDDAFPRDAAEAVLQAGHAARVDLYSIDELATEIAAAARHLFVENPGRRVRLKAIGGGGGKGQRILGGIAADAADPQAEAARAVEPVAGFVREILAEVKAAGVGDDKNILLELNVEKTRHNEIQLLGNGTWCISVGGRDCSLQMHEQKLLEVSVTQEGLTGAIAEALADGHAEEAAALETDLSTLRRMEEEAERFGLAVGLDSASTFECIVEGDRHYFMEVNTRIQVEHRVSELCYALRFTDPSDPENHVDVSSLVAAMVIVGCHGPRLPRPTRIPREGAAVEARLNATDRSLSPHAGGLVISWSDPIEHEIRDDQGICTKNPDSKQFVRYRLAGAYDSNVALLVTYGRKRRESYERLAEILRRAKIRGQDLATNLEFHYGLVHWFLGRNVWAQPTTAFVVPYLSQVGLLAEAARDLDVTAAFQEVCQRCEARIAATAPDGGKEARAATRKILALKDTLLRRPLEALFAEPHVLSAWLSHFRHRYTLEAGKVRWVDNPLQILWDTYRLLNMDEQPGAPPAHLIWDHDRALVDRGLGFYARLAERLGGAAAWPWPYLAERLEDAAPPDGFDAATWGRVRASHKGFQLGLELLAILPLLGERTGFFELRVEPDLSISIPERLRDKELFQRMRRVLAPPPTTKSDEIVAVSGGMFYPREAPGMPPLVERGAHFEAGAPLYVIEVMKMFNRVQAPFSGTITEVLVEGDGVIVQKGQPLFRVRPDEAHADEDHAAAAARKKSVTSSYVAAIG